MGDLGLGLRWAIALLAAGLWLGLLAAVEANAQGEPPEAKIAQFVDLNPSDEIAGVVVEFFPAPTGLVLEPIEWLEVAREDVPFGPLERCFEQPFNPIEDLDRPGWVRIRLVGVNGLLSEPSNAVPVGEPPAWMMSLTAVGTAGVVAATRRACSRRRHGVA